MQNGIYTVLEASAGAVVTAIVTLVLAYRRFSGGVRHTSADRLWDAQEKLRTDLTGILDRKDEEVLLLHREMEQAELRCKDEISVLRREIIQLRRENDEHG